ncbi:MAG: helix-turn-helix domain-containing protein [Balneola sp.]
MPVIDLLETFQIFIIIQCITFCVYLFTVKSDYSISNKLLGLFLIVLSLQMASNIFISTGNSFFYRSSLSLRFLFGPLFFLYVSSIITKDQKLTKYDFFHLVPFISVVFVLSINIRVDRVYFLAFTYFFLVGYLVFTYYVIHTYKKVLAETRSSSSDTSLKWIQLLLSFQALVIILDLVNNFNSRIEGWPVMEILMVEMVIILCMVNVMIFFGLKHPNLFTVINTEERLIVKDQKEKYASSALKDDDLVRIKEKLSMLMENEKPYLDPELTLTDLAEKISLSNRELSQVINTQFDRNFSEFINSYRVEEAIRIFEKNDDPKKTILEIIFEVGFNSKSSFYTAFKKQTNTTPKIYLAKIRSEKK